jgi:hypothetical protein
VDLLTRVVLMLVALLFLYLGVHSYGQENEDGVFVETEWFTIRGNAWAYFSVIGLLLISLVLLA